MVVGITPPPECLGASTLTELTRAGKIHIEVDEKFPQALGIRSILSCINVFGNARWEFLVNPFDNSPYLCSDFPVAAERIEDTLLMSRIMPLCPKIAVRVLPERMKSINACKFDFKDFWYRFRTIGHSEVAKINRLLVQCAEDSVFFLEDHEWVRTFIIKHRNFRLKNDVKVSSSSVDHLLMAQLQIEANTHLL